MVDVSIIIVSWNARNYLEKCLNMIRISSTYRLEVIVVDNASSDGSPEMVQEKFPSILLIRNQENLGFAKANNIGLTHAEGRYLCLVNSDVEMLDSCLEKMIQFMDRHPDIGLAGPRILNPDGSLQPSCRFFPTVWNNLCQTFWLHRLFSRSAFFSEPFMTFWGHDSVRDVDVLRGCFWMARREAWQAVGGLDESFYIYGEDIDWCRRFHLQGWRVVFYPEAQAIHYGGASSANAPLRFCLEMQRADLHYWRKYHGWRGEMVYRLILLLRHGLRGVGFGLLLCFSPASRTYRNGFTRSWAVFRFVLQKGGPEAGVCESPGKKSFSKRELDMGKNPQENL